MSRWQDRDEKKRYGREAQKSDVPPYPIHRADPRLSFSEAPTRISYIALVTDAVRERLMQTTST